MVVSFAVWKIFWERLSKKSVVVGSRLYSNNGTMHENKIPLRDTLIRRRIKLKMTSAVQPKRKISSKTDCNPFGRDELIQRIGGRRIRRQYSALSSQSDENDNQLKEITDDDMKDEKWSPVYRFRGIHFYAIVTRMKFFQTICSILALPYCYYEFMNDEISANTFVVMSIAAIAAPLVMIAFTRYFNRIIGVISVNESRTIVRIGHLSYWGGRNNKYIPIDDIIPLTESSENPSHWLTKLKSYSNEKNYLLLPTGKVEIVDTEVSKQIFGTNEYFLLKGAIITDKNYKEKPTENV